MPGCDVCPFRVDPRWACDETANSCAYDGRPWVDPGGPYTAALGEPVQLAAEVEAADGSEIVELRWEVGEKVLGTTLELDAVFDTPGGHVVTLVALDSEERTGRGVADVSIPEEP